MHFRGTLQNEMKAPFKDKIFEFFPTNISNTLFCKLFKPYLFIYLSNNFSNNTSKYFLNLL